MAFSASNKYTVILEAERIFSRKEKKITCQNVAERYSAGGSHGADRRRTPGHQRIPEPAGEGRIPDPGIPLLFRAGSQSFRTVGAGQETGKDFHICPEKLPHKKVMEMYGDTWNEGSRLH